MSGKIEASGDGILANVCDHEKVDDGATCLICRSCGAVGWLTSLRAGRLRLVWVRRDEDGLARLVGVEGGER